jgi:drug/metabolite transporter (DMT)-like permease
LTVLFWSGNFVLGRGVHDVVPPVALAFWRWTIALLILLPFALTPLKAQRHMIRKNWKILTLLALLSVTSFNTFIYIALQSTSAINTIMVNAMTPVFIPLIAWVGFRDRITLRQFSGVVLSFFGLAWIVSRGHPEILLTLQFATGDLWTLSAAMCWAVYTVLLRKRPEGLHPIAFLAAIIAVGLLFLLPVYLWEMSTGTVIRPTRTSILSVLYVAVFPSVLAYIFWNRAVGSVGATRAGVFMHLMPVFGIILAIIFLGERLNVYHVLGIVMIFAGIVLTTVNRFGWNSR